MTSFVGLVFVSFICLYPFHYKYDTLFRHIFTKLFWAISTGCRRTHSSVQCLLSDKGFSQTQALNLELSVRLSAPGSHPLRGDPPPGCSVGFSVGFSRDTCCWRLLLRSVCRTDAGADETTQVVTVLVCDTRGTSRAPGATCTQYITEY